MDKVVPSCVTTSKISQPKLLYLRFARKGLPDFIKLHQSEQLRCLEQFFAVTVIDEIENGNFDLLCDMHEPDLVIFESGVYVGRRNLKGLETNRTVPRLGFIHCDAYCPSRKDAIADMASWEVSDLFTTSAAMSSYTPSIASRLFVWPNFVDPKVYYDRKIFKAVPVLFTGSQAAMYPWRSKVSRLLTQRFPSLTMPHFGWVKTVDGQRMVHGDKYAEMISASMLAPACGTVAHEVVRKHFEIPASGTCLLTERTTGLLAAGFEDGVNCVFATESDVVEKVDWLLNNPDDLHRITSAGRKLVMDRHTASQRSEVLQWYELTRALRLEERVIQSEAFAQLEIVSRSDSSLARTEREPLTVDLAGLRRADAQLRIGKLDEAESEYLRCLNFIDNMAEPLLRLAILDLLRGSPVAAIERLRSTIQRAFVPGGAMEPDPVEWAYLIISLLCAGRLSEASACSAQFPDLSSATLVWARESVRILADGSTAASKLMHSQAIRNSIHIPLHDEQSDWYESLATMLAACGRMHDAHAIRTTMADINSADAFNSSAVVDSINGSRPDYSSTRIVEKLLRKSLRRRNEPIALISARRSALAVKRYALGLFNAKRHGIHLVEEDWPVVSEVTKLVVKEPINSALLISLSHNSQLHNCIISGLENNPHIRAITIATCSKILEHTHNSRKFSVCNHYFSNGIDIADLVNRNTSEVWPEAFASDLVAIDFDASSSFRLEPRCFSGKVIIIKGITTANGHAFLRAVMTQETHALDILDDKSNTGLAILRNLTKDSSTARI